MLLSMQEHAVHKRCGGPQAAEMYAPVQPVTPRKSKLKLTPSGVVAGSWSGSLGGAVKEQGAGSMTPPAAVLKSLTPPPSKNCSAESRAKAKEPPTDVVLKKLAALDRDEGLAAVRKAQTSHSTASVVGGASRTTPAVTVKRRPKPPPMPSASQPEVAHFDTKSIESPRLRLPRWQSLGSRGAKLYAWACAARLSAGAGAGLGLYEVRRGYREDALEAATQMLDYLGLEDEELGSRLDPSALREIGADVDPTALVFSKGDSCSAIANHLAAFRFQRAIERDDDKAEAEPRQAPPARLERLFEESFSAVGRVTETGQVLSAASERAAAAFALDTDDDPRAFLSDRSDDDPRAFLSDRPDDDTADTAVILHGKHSRDRSGAATPPGGVLQTAVTAVVVPQDVVELYPRTKAVAALHRAVARGDARAVRLAAVEGAGTAAAHEVGAFVTMARALHVAAARDGAFGAPSAGVVRALVGLGADLYAPDAMGYTPLHVAAATGNAAAIRALLDCSCSRPRDAGDDTDNAADPESPDNPTDGPARAASRRCHAGLTPLEVALARRRDMRELFASMLCRGRAFDVVFGDGPLGIKLALVRHAQQESRERSRQHAPQQPQPAAPLLPEAQQHHQHQHHQQGRPPFARQRPPPPPPPSADVTRHRRTHSVDETHGGDTGAKKAHHRRVRSHDDHLRADDADPDACPRTLQVASVNPDCRAGREIHAGDQLLAINGAVVACPDEAGFATIMAQLKLLTRPIRATFIAGNFPQLSVEDDPVIAALEKFSPPPARAHVDVLCASQANLDLDY